ncbi:hypothetical protein V865_005746 [Kwoniella europaea PYCC6329]|uniref:WW domain-containing protein n=1 Tax=Kwoniella europaea PYCC6329 TaxID=1423913 RepID=A0AAX4KPX4_9TREE
MAEEEVDWDDDWRGAGQPHPEISGNENGDETENGNGKDDDDVISLDGDEVEEVAEVEPTPSRNKVPPTGPRRGTNGTTETSTENGGSSPLPPGWTAIMSKSHNRHFFFHKESNTTVWEKPSNTNVNTKDQEEVQPQSPPLATTQENSLGTVEETKTQDLPSIGQAQNSSSGNNLSSAQNSRLSKQPPSGPARRDIPSQQDVRGGIEGKPHYDKYWAQRDTSSHPSQQTQIQDRRRPRDISPGANRPGYDSRQGDRDYKRFKGDDERRAGPGESRRQQGPPSVTTSTSRPADVRDSRSSQAPSTSAPADDPRTRPYNGAFVPPVAKYSNQTRPRSPSPPPRGSSAPYRPPPSSRYPRDSRGPPRDEGYSRSPLPPPSRGHDYPSYPSRGPHRPPPVDEAEIERAKIREEARKAQEKLEFLKQAEARLEREMSEKRNDPYASRGPGPRRDGPPPYDSRSGPASSYDQDRRPYPPREHSSRPPEPSRYDREPSYGSSRGYDSRPPPASRGGYAGSIRGGYESRSTRGGYGYDTRPPPRGASPPPFSGRPRSPPPPSGGRYSDSRRSPPPPSFASRLGPRSDHGYGGGDRDLASRLGPGRGRGNELAAEPMSDRRSPPPPPPYRGAGARPLAERMSIDRDRERGGR